jgi:hypothetical protein
MQSMKEHRTHFEQVRQKLDYELKPWNIIASKRYIFLRLLALIFYAALQGD